MEGCAARIGDGDTIHGIHRNKVEHLEHRAARAMGHFGTKWNTWDTDPRDCPSPGHPRCPWSVEVREDCRLLSRVPVAVWRVTHAGKGRRGHPDGMGPAHPTKRRLSFTRPRAG